MKEVKCLHCGCQTENPDLDKNKVCNFCQAIYFLEIEGDGEDTLYDLADSRGLEREKLDVKIKYGYDVLKDNQKDEYGIQVDLYSVKI